jgi:RNA polymerase sigma-70 factor (ECF subfamily)
MDSRSVQAGDSKKMMAPEAAADDAALVRAAQRGDREAFGVLISRHAQSILNVTTRMLGPADAEDVAQDTFVAAFKSLSGFQFGAKFSTWLYRIAVNKCNDALRARPDTIPLDPADDQSTMAWEAADETTPHREIERVELTLAIERGIRVLPPLYRESFVLRHVEGLDYDDMSAILGVNRDTLKMRVYKARTLLRQSLAHLADGVHR